MARGAAVRFAATLDGRTRMVEVAGGDGRFRVTIDDQVWEVDARLIPQGICSLLIDGASYVPDVKDEAGLFVVDIGGERYEIEVEEETRHIIRTRGRAAGESGGRVLKAPMPGKVTHVAVRPGDAVAAGATLLVIEAMKMENELKAKSSGVVKEVRVEAGQPVNPGDVLLVIE
jgi:pyruvate carboxylase subunit B